VIKGLLISFTSSETSIFSIWDAVAAVTHNMLQDTWTEFAYRLGFVVKPAKVCCTRKEVFIVCLCNDAHRISV
jgi:hypothetical protein